MDNARFYCTFPSVLGQARAVDFNLSNIRGWIINRGAVTLLHSAGNRSRPRFKWTLRPILGLVLSHTLHKLRGRCTQCILHSRRCCLKYSQVLVRTCRLQERHSILIKLKYWHSSVQRDIKVCDSIAQSLGFFQEQDRSWRKRRLRREVSAPEDHLLVFRKTALR